MADDLAQDLQPSEREELHSKFSKAKSSIKAERQTQLGSSPDQSVDQNTTEAESEFDTESTAEKQKKSSSSHDQTVWDADSETESFNDNRQGTEGMPASNLVVNFYGLPIMQRIWYYLLSVFSRKPAEGIFTEKKINNIRETVIAQNNNLIIFDYNEEIHLLSPYLPENFNTVFKLSLEVLPIVNELNHNLNFMQDIVSKLIFNNYQSSSGNTVQTDPTCFISEEELCSLIFMGGEVFQNKIDSLMTEIRISSKFLPISIYKYAVQVLKPIYQFQKICYFPFSSFFHVFRTIRPQSNGNIYVNVLPKDAYDSISILYQLMEKVGPIKFDKNHCRDIISSYFNMVNRKDFATSSSQTAVQFLESFIHLETVWNNFILKTPIEPLLLFAAHNPYLELPIVQKIDKEILENMPVQIEKVYLQTVRENIKSLSRQIRESRTHSYREKYLSDNKSPYAIAYNPRRSDLLPPNALPKVIERGPFAHWQSFSYVQDFFTYFAPTNILNPLHSLSKAVFTFGNFISATIIEFLGQLDSCRAKLEIIDQNLRPEHRLDIEIKEIIIRIEQRTEGANEEYATMIIKIDSDVRLLIDQVIKILQDFAVHSIPAIEQAFCDPACFQRFTVFIPQLHYMCDFNSPECAPMTPEKILGLWKQYISEFTLLLCDQVELERQDILGQVSKMATIGERRARPPQE